MYCRPLCYLQGHQVLTQRLMQKNFQQMMTPAKQEGNDQRQRHRRRYIKTKGPSSSSSSNMKMTKMSSYKGKGIFRPMRPYKRPTKPIMMKPTKRPTTTTTRAPVQSPVMPSTNMPTVETGTVSRETSWFVNRCCIFQHNIALVILYSTGPSIRVNPEQKQAQYL